MEAFSVFWFSITLDMNFYIFAGYFIIIMKSFFCVENNLNSLEISLTG